MFHQEASVETIQMNKWNAQILNWRPWLGKRERGRSQMRWEDDIERHAETCPGSGRPKMETLGKKLERPTSANGSKTFEKKKCNKL